ncbi:MAG: hypothetical protein ACR2QM_11420 [Longimicrobiales bacterium]
MISMRSAASRSAPAKATCLFGLALFLHAFGHPVLDPSCLGHGTPVGAGDGSHGEMVGQHAMGHDDGRHQPAEDGHDESAPGHHEICICEFAGKTAPDSPVALGTETRPLHAATTAPESVALLRPSFELPPANGPPATA